MNSSESDLIREIRRGDQNAFQVLYRRYSDLLFAFILHHLNNRDVASDIWQDTWCIAVEKIDTYQFRSSFFTWLCAIARNKIFDYYRQSQKQTSFEEAEKIQFDIDSEEIDIDPADTRIQSAVISVLADLTDDYRTILIEKYIENRGIGEIAAAMNKSYKATESMLTRAREAFRKKFKQTNRT